MDARHSPLPEWRVKLERWYLDCQLSDDQRETVEEMIATRESQIADLLAALQDLVTAYPTHRSMTNGEHLLLDAARAAITKATQP